MPYIFPSEEWIAAFRDKINSNPNYRQSAAKWEHGTIALVLQFDEDALARMKSYPAIAKDFKEEEPVIGIWLDLYHGECREAKKVDWEEAQKAKFIIRGDYSNWKSIIKKELQPVKGIMQGKLKLKGDLPTLIRFVQAAQDLVDSGTMVDTKFIDD